MMLVPIWKRSIERLFWFLNCNKPPSTLARSVTSSPQTLVSVIALAFVRRYLVSPPSPENSWPNSNTFLVLGSKLRRLESNL